MLCPPPREIIIQVSACIASSESKVLTPPGLAFTGRDQGCAPVERLVVFYA
jgi:hypothetical protein